MDDDPGWRLLDSGELVHITSDLDVTATRAIGRPPVHRLTLDDLEPPAASSQSPAKLP